MVEQTGRRAPVRLSRRRLIATTVAGAAGTASFILNTPSSAASSPTVGMRAEGEVDISQIRLDPTPNDVPAFVRTRSSVQNQFANSVGIDNLSPVSSSVYAVDHQEIVNFSLLNVIYEVSPFPTGDNFHLGWVRNLPFETRGFARFDSKRWIGVGWNLSYNFVEQGYLSSCTDGNGVVRSAKYPQLLEGVAFLPDGDKACIITASTPATQRKVLVYDLNSTQITEVPTSGFYDDESSILDFTSMSDQVDSEGYLYNFAIALSDETSEIRSVKLQHRADNVEAATLPNSLKYNNILRWVRDGNNNQILAAVNDSVITPFHQSASANLNNVYRIGTVLEYKQNSTLATIYQPNLLLVDDVLSLAGYIGKADVSVPSIKNDKFGNRIMAVNVLKINAQTKKQDSFGRILIVGNIKDTLSQALVPADGAFPKKSFIHGMEYITRGSNDYLVVTLSSDEGMGNGFYIKEITSGLDASPWKQVREGGEVSTETMFPFFSNSQTVKQGQ